MLRLVECGSCGGCHREEYDGDCRQDSERFADAEDFAERTKLREHVDFEVIGYEES